MRRRRSARLRDLISRIYAQRGQVRVLDVGGTRYYWNIVPREFLLHYHVQILIVNLPGVEKGEPDDIFTYREGDGRNLEMFPDKSFDLVHSNSVVEHVGGWDDMQRFAGEISRLGDHYFVQTPSFWFPMEPHCMTPFFHWLPLSFRVRLVMKFELGHWKMAETPSEALEIVQSARLLRKSQMRKLFPDAKIYTEWFLFPKSYIAIRG